ncbi:hypothetical protein D3C85_1206920 [compost metagenome]
MCLPKKQRRAQPSRGVDSPPSAHLYSPYPTIPRNIAIPSGPSKVLAPVAAAQTPAPAPKPEIMAEKKYLDAAAVSPPFQVRLAANPDRVASYNPATAAMLPPTRTNTLPTRAAAFAAVIAWVDKLLTFCTCTAPFSNAMPTISTPPPNTPKLLPYNANLASTAFSPIACSTSLRLLFSESLSRYIPPIASNSSLLPTAPRSPVKPLRTHLAAKYEDTLMPCSTLRACGSSVPTPTAISTSVAWAPLPS